MIPGVGPITDIIPGMTTSCIGVGGLAALRGVTVAVDIVCVDIF